MFSAKLLKTPAGPPVPVWTEKSASVTESADFLAETLLEKQAEGGIGDRFAALKEWAKANPELAISLGGAAGGGLLGMLSARGQDEEDRDYGQSGLSGALSGGLLGLGAGAVYRYAPSIYKKITQTPDIDPASPVGKVIAQKGQEIAKLYTTDKKKFTEIYPELPPAIQQSALAAIAGGAGQSKTPAAQGVAVPQSSAANRSQAERGYRAAPVEEQYGLPTKLFGKNRGGKIEEGLRNIGLGGIPGLTVMPDQMTDIDKAVENSALLSQLARKAKTPEDIARMNQLRDQMVQDYKSPAGETDLEAFDLADAYKTNPALTRALGAVGGLGEYGRNLNLRHKFEEASKASPEFIQQGAKSLADKVAPAKLGPKPPPGAPNTASELQKQLTLLSGQGIAPNIPAAPAHELQQYYNQLSKYHDAVVSRQGVMGKIRPAALGRYVAHTALAPVNAASALYNAGAKIYDKFKRPTTPSAKLPMIGPTVRPGSVPPVQPPQGLRPISFDRLRQVVHEGRALDPTVKTRIGNYAGRLGTGQQRFNPIDLPDFHRAAPPYSLRRMGLTAGIATPAIGIGLPMLMNYTKGLQRNADPNYVKNLFEGAAGSTP